MNLLPNKKGKDFRLSFRNNYLALVAIFLLFTTSISAQTFVPYEPLFWKGFQRVIIDSSLTLPKGITARRLPSTKYDTGQIRYNLADSSVYISTGSQFLKVGAGGSGTDGLNDVVTRNPQTTQPYMIVTNNAATVAVQKAGGFPGAGIVASSGYIYMKNAGNKAVNISGTNVTADRFLEAPDGDGTIARTSDSTGKWPTTVFKRNDSVFIVKGGIEVFAFKDSIGAGGGGSYTASNGITLSTADFQLGGALAATTSITGNQTLNLGTSGSKLASLNTNTSGNTGFIAAGTISATGAIVQIFGTDSTVILNIDETTDPIPVLCRASNGRLWWKTITGGSTDTTSLSARIDLKLNKTDTASLSNRIDLKLNKSDTASLSNRINLKVNISDTASMLSTYLHKVDTTVFSRKSMPAYSIRVNNTSGTADATNFTFRSVGAQSISSGVPTWTAGTAPSGTENHSYTWSQIGKQVTVTFYLTYVTAGATCTAVSFPLPTDLPLPLELSGTGAADEFLYIGSGYIGTAKTTVPAVSARPTIRVNSGDTGYDIYMAGTSVSARVAYGTITYTAQ